MRNTLSYPTFGTPERENHPNFNVIIVYEDFDSGKHAKRAYDILAKNLGKNCTCSNQMWKFDVLSAPKLREIAANDAAAADIALISVRGNCDLPAEVKSWLSLWLAAPGRTIAIVALHDRSELNKESWLAICATLSEAASQAGVKFFAQPEDETSSPSFSEHFIFQRSTVAHEDPSLFPVPNLQQHERNSPRWCISE
jgi:hypothetical protein